MSKRSNADDLREEYDFTAKQLREGVLGKYAARYAEGVDRLYEEVAGRGTEMLSAPSTEPWGLREFSIRTPDGHRIKFGEPVLAASQRAHTADGRLRRPQPIRSTSDGTDRHSISDVTCRVPVLRFLT